MGRIQQVVADDRHKTSHWLTASVICLRKSQPRGMASISMKTLPGPKWRLSSHGRPVSSALSLHR